MYLLVKFGGHRFYRNGDIKCYINSYMDTLDKAELTTTSIHHIVKFLKSGIPIYHPKIPDKAGRKTKRVSRRKTQVIAKFYALHANAKNVV